MEIIINGEHWNVGVAALSRSLRRENKYRVTTEDGIVHREVRATYVDFTLRLGNVDAVTYDAFMALLRSARGDAELTVATGQGAYESFTGEFDGISDSVLLENADGVFYDNLTLCFRGTVPVEVVA